MAEYIEREALLKGLCDNDPSRMEDYYYNAILGAPAADVEPVKHGEWVYGEFDIPHCSECGNEIMPHLISNYCPNCGAKMDGKEVQE